MTSVSKIEAGFYAVSDGRAIVKDGQSWFVLNVDGSRDFGPLPTLKSAKEYVGTGTISGSQQNLATSYGRRQSKREFNSYLAAEAKSGNYWPVILWFVVVGAFLFLMSLLRGE